MRMNACVDSNIVIFFVEIFTSIFSLCAQVRRRLCAQVRITVPKKS